jgi:hypothetical protein
VALLFEPRPRDATGSSRNIRKFLILWSPIIRRRIEQELRALSFLEVEEARMFELALRERVRVIVTMGEEEVVA